MKKHTLAQAGILAVLNAGLTSYTQQAQATPSDATSHADAHELGAGTSKGIEDNSFLLEEAYNQEDRVVQHIQSFQYINSEWTYNFGQEWPIFGRKHQLSYNLPISRTSSSGSPGLGDFQLSYRYQLVDKERWACSPRLSVVLPSGNSQLGLGNGAVGYQVGLPFSVKIWPWLTTHWNFGLSLTPGARDSAGNVANIGGYNISKSFVWNASDRWNAMLEMVMDSRRVINGPGSTEPKREFILNPGVRHAINLADGTQIVPGLSVPMTVLSPDGFKWGVLAYLSIENPY